MIAFYFQSGSALCDVTLKVGEQEFPAHRALLCHASKYFEAMFDGHFVEKKSREADLTDIVGDSDTLVELLDFMYTGALNISAANIEALLRATSLLLLEKGKAQCVTYLLEHLTPDNVVSVLTLADEFGLSAFYQIALEVILARFHDSIIFSSQMDEVHIDFMEFLLEQGAFKYVQEEDLMSLLGQKFSAIVEDSNSTAKEKITSVKRLFGMFFNALPNSSYFFAEVIHNLIDPLLTSDNEEKLVLTCAALTEMLESKKNGENNVTAPASTGACKVVAPQTQEAVVIYSIKESHDENNEDSGTLKVSAYLTEDKTWVELKSVTCQDIILNTHNGLVGLTDDLGIDMYFLNTRAFSLDVAVLEEGKNRFRQTMHYNSHQCGDPCNDKHLFFCFDNKLLSVTKLNPTMTATSHTVHHHAASAQESNVYILHQYQKYEMGTEEMDRYIEVV